MRFKNVMPGDTVTRMLAGDIPMKLVVTSIDRDFIYCGVPGVGWKFRRDNGGEVDEMLEWDGISKTGSFLSDPEK